MSNAKKRILFVPAELIVAVDKLSNRTVLRCLRALELWQTGEYDYILMAGGKFLSPQIQMTSAGQLMGSWFEHQGVDPDKLIVEIFSLDTFENITTSIMLMAAWGLDPKACEITVVTQWQHGWRFRLSFRAMLGITVKTLPVDYSLSFIETLKEYAFILVHIVDPRGTGFLATYNRNQRRLAAAGP